MSSWRRTAKSWWGIRMAISVLLGLKVVDPGQRRCWWTRHWGSALQHLWMMWSNNQELLREALKALTALRHH